MRHAFRHSVAPWVFLQRRNLCSSIPFGLKALLYTHPPLLNFHGCVTSSSPGGGWLCWEMLFRALPRASPCAWEGRERWAAVVSCDAMKSEPLCIHRRHPSAVGHGGLRGDLTLHTHTQTHTYIHCCHPSAVPAEGEFRPAVGIWVRGVFSTRRRDLIGALLGVCLFSFVGTRAGGGWEDSLVCVCV